MSIDNNIFKGSMVAIATPMKNDESLDFDSMEQLIEFHIENKTDAIVSVGTTGESATLDFNEHSEVIKKTLEIVNKRIPVIAGTGANSTSEALELTKKSKILGADSCNGWTYWHYQSGNTLKPIDELRQRLRPNS